MASPASDGSDFPHLSSEEAGYLYMTPVGISWWPLEAPRLKDTGKDIWKSASACCGRPDSIYYLIIILCQQVGLMGKAIPGPMGPRGGPKHFVSVMVERPRGKCSLWDRTGETC